MGVPPRMSAAFFGGDGGVSGISGVSLGCLDRLRGRFLLVFCGCGQGQALMSGLVFVYPLSVMPAQSGAGWAYRVSPPIASAVGPERVIYAVHG